RARSRSPRLSRQRDDASPGSLSLSVLGALRRVRREGDLRRLSRRLCLAVQQRRGASDPRRHQGDRPAPLHQGPGQDLRGRGGIAPVRADAGLSAGAGQEGGPATRIAAMAMTTWRLYSCDDHLDLWNLPQDVWDGRVPARFRERAPRVVEQGESAWWM